MGYAILNNDTVLIVYKQWMLTTHDIIARIFQLFAFFVGHVALGIPYMYVCHNKALHCNKKDLFVFAS